MHQVIPFAFDGKEIRVIRDENGEPLFVGKDICESLGYSNHNDAMNLHCKGVVKRYPLQTAGGKQQVRVLTEGDMYRLMTHSKLESAERFEALVFDEILPTIRKTGKYEAKPVSAANAPRLSVVAQDWKAAKALAKARGLNDNHSILSADKAALTLHGLDVPALLGAPVLKADERGLTLTPGEALRMLPRFASLHIQHAGRIANAMLENNGYLVKSNGQWEPTEKAKSLGEWGDVNTSHGKGSPKKQWRWFKEIIDVFAGFEAANDDDKSAA